MVAFIAYNGIGLGDGLEFGNRQPGTNAKFITKS